jgi:predicted acylesterase/phospholipase RssA
MKTRPVCWFSLFAALLLATLGGCASSPERVLSRQPVPYAALPNGHDPLNPDRMVGFVSEGASADEGVLVTLEKLRGHALNILELSGGGQYGAFGAGLLKGLTESGQRPEFDVVTGVSTGALLATHAFLGTPGDDALLEEIFTTISAADIYTSKKRLFSLLWGRNSVYDTAPLQALLDKYITAEVLQRVAAAHDEHRVLLVGTTNLDYGQTWVWNMGLIAKEGTREALELYKQVLRASAAPPIVFPPVEIYGYLFVDGGVRQNLVVVGLAGTEKPKPPQFGPGTVFVVQNGQKKSRPQAVRNDALHLAGPALGVMMSNSTDGQLLRAYAAAKVRGYEFRMVSIPDDADVGHNFLAFDTGQMQTSFNLGYELGRSADPWRHIPPILQDIPTWLLDDMQLQLSRSDR